MNPHPNKIAPVLYGTAVMTIISVFPFVSLINLFCCAGIALGGLAGAYAYQRELKDTNIKMSSSDSFMIGILSGLLSAILVTGINLLITLFSEANPLDEMMKILSEFINNPPPEVSEELNKLSDEYNKYGYSPTITIVSFIINLIIYPLFGILGALIGRSIIRKKTSSSY